MTIKLSPELETYIQRKLDSGKYSSPDAVIAQALQVMRNVEEALPETQDDLRREIDAGLKDVEEGRVSEWNLEEELQRIREMARGKKAV